MGLVPPGIGQQNVLYMREANATPQTSYLPTSIREAQPLYCIASQTYWFCSDASDQNNLVWKQLANAS